MLFPMRTLALLCGLALLTACSSVPRPIDDPNTRFAIAGYSVGVPPGEWTLATEESKGVVMVSADQEAGRSFVATAGVPGSMGDFADLEALRAHLERQITAQPGIASATFEVHTGDPGWVSGRILSRPFRETAVAADTEAPKLREVLTRTWLLPNGTQFVMAVNQTAPESVGLADLQAEFEPFFASFRPE